MPTPLFPPDNQLVQIEQGRVGNCYLLAGLDCVLNKMQGGRALAKQRFVEYPDGSVRVQIPRNPHSPHLNPAVIGSKYVLDQSDPNFDYWHIPKSEIDRMDAPGNGAKSNCLAVKIMERLSSYYYVKPPKIAGIGESLIAHNHQGHGERYMGTATDFVANLMGVHVDQLFGRLYDRQMNFDDKVNKLIRLREMNPYAPVYLELNWGQPDAFGKIHGRHAVRVEKIVPDGRGSYNVHVVNPWNNTRLETQVFNIADLKVRDAWFSHYSPSSQHSALTETLLACSSTQIGKHVYANPDLMKTLLTFQDKAPHLANNPKIIELLVNTHKNNPKLLPVIDKLLSDPTQAARLATNIQYSNQREDLLVRGIVNQLVYHPDQSLLSSLPIRLTGPILRDMAVDAKYRKDLPLEQYFSSHHFVRRILDGAIEQKASSDPMMGGDKALARTSIEHELVNYYLSGNKNYVTEPNLRAFIDAGVIDIRTLPQVLSQPTMLSKSLHYFLNTRDPIPVGLTDFFSKVTPTQIDAGFANDFFTKARCSDVKRLCEDLYKLSATNPALAKHLLTVGRQKVDGFYPGAFERFAQNASAVSSPDLSNWLDVDGNKQAKIDAQILISNNVRQINSIPVVYPDPTNVDAINQHSKRLRTLLEDLAKNPELERAKRVLGMPTNPPEIQQALDAKMREVSTIELRHLQQIKQQSAQKIIDNHVQKIKDFPVNLGGLNTQQLEQRAVDLRSILNEDSYILAKKALGLKSDPPEITGVFVAKAQIIDAAIEEHLKHDKVQVKDTILGEVNILIGRVKGKGADAIARVIEQVKEEYNNDPYHDGLLSAKEKEELFRDIANIGARMGALPQAKLEQLKQIDLQRLKAPDQLTPDVRQLVKDLLRAPILIVTPIPIITPIPIPVTQDKIAKCKREIEAITVSYPDHSISGVREHRNALLREIKNIREKPEYADVSNQDAVLWAQKAKVDKIKAESDALLIAAYEKQFNDFPIKFKETTLSGAGTEARAMHQELRIAYKQARRDLGCIDNLSISKTLPTVIENAFKAAGERIDKAVHDYKNDLSQKGHKHHNFKAKLVHVKNGLEIFDHHLEEIEKMVDRLKASPSKQHKYGHAEELRNSLVEARNTFLTKNKDMNEFCEKCTNAIAKAKPHLEQHEASNTGIKALDAIIDFFKAKLTKTKSAEVVEEVSYEVGRLSGG
ncbi:hypothetical protein [Legionella fallonii]|uniref:Uncharacterized protein n=1 Tax=Legionella fallonii LLAP-10 TaxID=1212491 RepID=A0A098G176_9GAMM|nr:hypothetical protein [Legionella fallonii]CEG56217.1 protein of unknown function [Legionella fallonii LLAP-10]